MTSSATEKTAYVRCGKCGRSVTVTVPAGEIRGRTTCGCGHLVEAPDRKVRVPDVVLPRM